VAPKTFLSNISVASPCKADWNSMSGNDQVRFCQHCNLNVHHLSMMSRNQAERLVASANGRLCIRYVRDPGGRFLPLPVKQKLHRIGRRASRIAAGIFTATISISSASAQSPSSGSRLRDVQVPSASEPVKSWESGNTIAGTIADQNGAVIRGATIFISNDDLRVALYTSSDDTGQFKVNQLQPGFYKVRIEAPGFAAQETARMYLGGSDESRVDRTLKIAEIEVQTEVYETVEQTTSGGMVIVSPENPFIRAAQEDNLEELTKLISGADVNARDLSTRTTALEHAVRNANREMVQLLLSFGADVNARNEGKETVLMLIDGDATSDLIWDLINAGADVNLKDGDDNTALMRAASIGNLEVLKTFLEAGAQVNDKNTNGVTALMQAAAEGQVNIVRALVLAGADLNLKDGEDENALDKALDNSRLAVVRFLKSRGAFESVAKAEKPQPE
jgi:hypothetical protein